MKETPPDGLGPTPHRRGDGLTQRRRSGTSRVFSALQRRPVRAPEEGRGGRPERPPVAHPERPPHDRGALPSVNAEEAKVAWALSEDKQDGLASTLRTLLLRVEEGYGGAAVLVGARSRDGRGFDGRPASGRRAAEEAHQQAVHRIAPLDVLIATCRREAFDWEPVVLGGRRGRLHSCGADRGEDPPRPLEEDVRSGLDDRFGRRDAATGMRVFTPADPGAIVGRWPV